METHFRGGSFNLNVLTRLVREPPTERPNSGGGSHYFTRHKGAAFFRNPPFWGGSFNLKPLANERAACLKPSDLGGGSYNFKT